MDVLGVDLGLTATGVCDADGASVISVKGAGIERVSIIAERVLTFARPCGVVVLEHHMHFKGAAVFVVEVHGVLKYLLHLEGIPVALVQPALLKKFATGKGNAPKGLMLQQAISRHGFEGYDDNAVDAFWLRLMGVAYVEHSRSGRELPGYQLEAMAKVSWPSMREEVGTPA